MHPTCTLGLLLGQCLGDHEVSGIKLEPPRYKACDQLTEQSLYALMNPRPHTCKEKRSSLSYISSTSLLSYIKFKEN